jgi:pyroglutamyl-peptidase
MRKLLLTGFGPFHTHPTNPTGEVVELLDGSSIAGWEIKGRILPVVFDEVYSTFKKLIEDEKPDAVIMTGLAWSREVVSLERVAINCLDSVRKDNSGKEVHDQKVSPDGENAYFSTLPLREMKLTLEQLKIPCEISNTAGTYVCNQIMYLCLEYCQKNGLEAPAGFIHLPPDRTLKTDSQWEIKDLSLALSELIKVLK